MLTENNNILSAPFNEKYKFLFDEPPKYNVINMLLIFIWRTWILFVKHQDVQMYVVAKVILIHTFQAKGLKLSQ